MGNRKFGGLSDTCVTLRGATVFPHSSDNTCGVLDAEGAFCDFSRGVMGPRRAAGIPVMPADGPARDLSGTYLYGGWLRAHFGHFLLESTSRLWALQDLDRPIDGVIFSPFRSGGLRQARDRYGSFLKALAGETPLEFVRAPTRIETLIVPDPGFGHHDRVLGSPKYRDFTRDRVARSIKARGPEKLYVSRSALPAKRGGVLGEAIIEAALAAEGYTIFHPQRHTLEEQLEHYRAARCLVALDGSALHLAAYALQPGARVGIILRRHAALLDGLAQQVALFADATVHQIDALRASWIDADAKRVDFRSLGEVDFSAVFAQLADHGFTTVPATAPSTNVAALIADTGRGDMRRIEVA